MNIPSDILREPPVAAKVAAPETLPATRLLAWSVRRELWENRSIYLAPLIAAALVVFGFLVSTVHEPNTWRALAALEPERLALQLTIRYGIVALPIIFTAFTVAAFYCLDALYGERRDRSILFWKSLPVSDLTAVLGKAGIPLVVVPLVAAAIAVATQLIILLLSTAILPAKGISATTLWTELPLFRMPLVLIYGLFTLALWHAPIYGWLLLVSSWARRSTFLWAVLPPLAVIFVERISLGTSYFGSLLKYRLMGGLPEAFVVTVNDHKFDGLPALDPFKFLSSPGLWAGLIVAAALLAAAVRLRRLREPS
ncbi:MAG: ABC transporter permease [Betaproteobacteria bacterium]